MKQLMVNPIGEVNKLQNSWSIKIFESYKDGLLHVDSFSHAHVVWWGHLTDEPYNRQKTIVENLFKNGPLETGVFATRTPARPNPILISSIKIEKLDKEKGIIYTPFIDADEGTPVLDIKPYFPMERIKYCQVPQWCRHWPQWQEDTTGFNWQKEIQIAR